MAGLLEQLFGNDPSGAKNQAMGQAINGLLGGNLRRGLLGANEVFAMEPERQARAQLLQMDMDSKRMALEKARRDEAMEQDILGAAKRSYRSPELANAMSMGPMPDGSAVPQVAPGFDQQQFLSQLYGINPMKAVSFEQAMAKDNSPLTVAPGASLVDRKSLKPVFTAPVAPKEAAPTEIARLSMEMNALAPNDPMRAVYANAIKKATTHQPGTQVNVNTEKPLLNEIAGGLGKSITTAKDNAQGALGTINTVNRLMDALDSGKVMAGPATTFRQSALQVGNLLGVTGKDAQERMLNTRQAIQSLAQLELDAAQQMKGQGQITEAERAIIRRAASGDIDGMTAGELRLLGGVLDRTARFKIRSYNQQAAPLKNMPNAAPIAPFLDVAEPEPRKQSNVLRFDAQGNPVR